MYRTRISEKMVLILIPFVLIALDIAFAEFAEDPPVYIGQWTVSSPSGTAFDYWGNIYILDRSQKLVKKYDNRGVPITEWISCGADDPSQCFAPYDIAVDSYGNVYVTDYMGITKFDQDGKFMTIFGFTGGTGPGIAVHSFVDSSADSSGTPATSIFVANSPNHSIQKFSPDGTLLKEWGKYGNLAGQFKFPYDVAVDSAGNVYVADANNSRIQKFDPEGIFLASWSTTRPSGIDIDSADNVYAISWLNCSIEKFTSEGVLLTQWGNCGAEEGQFTSPFRINVSPEGEIYVSDTGNNRIQVFESADKDNDGISNTEDNCRENYNPGQEDADQDGTGDQCDGCPSDPENDIDGDGICGDVDNCPAYSNTDQADADEDGVGDICDICPYDADNDIDRDGICGDVDNCPEDPNKADPGICGCGVVDTDSDEDGIADCVDNCPAVKNPDQTDRDSDGIGDACDTTSRTICSILRNDHRPFLLDRDFFKFTGTKGETVTIRLEADPPGAGTGKQAGLLLWHNIRRVWFMKKDWGILPNEITVALPATGRYYIGVAEQPKFARGIRYRGNYCLTLEASPATYQTLAPAFRVE